jgi:predicted unusual protein kinase regulating ubiquinone biosynthesis (AarF/ABC1/UbiB family)
MMQKHNMDDVELQKVYDEFLQILSRMCMEHNPQMVTGTMMALALRLYKTTLAPEDFKRMIQTVYDSADSIEPFEHLNTQLDPKNLH